MSVPAVAGVSEMLFALLVTSQSPKSPDPPLPVVEEEELLEPQAARPTVKASALVSPRVRLRCMWNIVLPLVRRPGGLGARLVPRCGGVKDIRSFGAVRGTMRLPR
ncbi:MAG: hypothetical protein WKF73_19130 [Nocardioidaceae bacterium]